MKLNIKLYRSLSGDSDYELSKSDINSPIVQAIIRAVSESTGELISDIQKEIENEHAKSKSKVTGYKLAEGTIENIFESASFDQLSKIDHDKIGIPKFSKKIFFELMFLIRKSNRAYSPLINVWQPKGIAVPDVVFVPDPLEDKTSNSVTTAACTANAKLIFNIDFCNKLIAHAFLKNERVKAHSPSSLWYVSYGGTIPDYYCYIDFLIRHELDHYSFGDHFYVKETLPYLKAKYPELTEKEHYYLSNIVGDFIINHKKLQMGMPQIPMGIFSQKYNLSNYKSYSALMDDVVKEYLENKQNSQDEGEGEGSGKGKGSGNDALDEMSDSQDDHLDHDQDAPETGKGKSRDSGIEKASDKESEDAKKESQKRSSEEGELSKDQKSSGVRGGKGGSRYDSNPLDVNLSQRKTKVLWKTIFKNLIGEAGKAIDYSYRKPDRRSITNAQVTLPKLGTGVIKKGIIIDNNPIQKGKNLLLMIDDSGSMIRQLMRVLPELYAMLKSAQGKSLDKILIIKFSDSFDIYSLDTRTKKCNMFKNLGAKSADEVMEVLGRNKPDSTTSMESTLSMSVGSGTNLSFNLIHTYKKLVTDYNFSGVLLTDSDVLSQPDTFGLYLDVNKLAQGRVNSFVIFDSQDTYRECYNQFSNGREGFIQKVVSVFPN